mgnify:CR=1 FL=1
MKKGAVGACLDRGFGDTCRLPSGSVVCELYPVWSWSFGAKCLAPHLLQTMHTGCSWSVCACVCVYAAAGAAAVCVQVYVWSVKTGRLLDVLAGHEGPVSGLAFSPTQPLLASCSWDK